MNRVQRLFTTVSVLAALVLTAQAEWTLAIAAGWHQAVAWAWPAALDTYVLASFRAGRDRHWALGLMALSVSGAHAVPIAYPGGLPWWLAGGLSVIPPLVAWRVHELSRHGDQDAAVVPDLAPAITQVSPPAPVAITPVTPPVTPVTPSSPPAVLTPVPDQDTDTAPSPGITPVSPDQTGGDVPAVVDITGVTHQDTGVITPGMSTREQVAGWRTAYPDMTGAEIARRVGVSPQTVSKHLRSLTPAIPDLTSANA